MDSSKARTAERHVIAGGGIAAPLKEIADAFARTTGHRIALRFGAVPKLVGVTAVPEPIDLCVVPQDMFLDNGARVRFTGDHRCSLPDRATATPEPAKSP